MASLNKSSTVTDIVNAIKALNPEIALHSGSETIMIQYWTAIIGALYDRITSDLQMTLNTDIISKDSLIANTSTGVITGTGKLNDKVSTVV